MADDVSMRTLLCMNTSSFGRVDRSQPSPLGLCKFAQLLAANDGKLSDLPALSGRFGAIDSAVMSVAKSAVSAGTTTDTAWASSLVDHQKLSSDFISAYRPRTLIGRLTGLRYVAFQTRTLRSGAMAGAAWVGEAAPIPVGSGAFDSIFLTSTKISGIAVLSKELVRFSSPSNDSYVQAEMIKATALCEDRSFIDPASAGVDGVSPASITSTATPIHSSGSTGAAINADLEALGRQLVDQGSDLVNCVWVMHPRTALYLSFLKEDGVRVFPEVNAAGGSIAGLEVLTSLGVPILQSPGQTYISLLDPSRVVIADDNVATVDTSNQAAVQMLSNPATGATQMISLYQVGAVGIRVLREVNWKAADGSAVALLDEVAF